MNKAKKIGMVLVILILLALIGMTGFYFYAMTPIGTSDEKITYVLNPGTSKIQVAEELKEAGLIHSSFAVKIYLFFHSELNLQAGTYELKESESPKEILNRMHKGDIKNDRLTVTLIEGRRLTEYVSRISEKLPFTEEELLDKMNNATYLNQLIEKYWFLDESILNQELYYPLEGYLFPDTYEFFEHSTCEEVIEKILDHTGQKLESIKEEIMASNYSVHEILSMASIIELEAVSEGDRNTVSQVIHKRLEMGKGLGMDVTTYYAVKKEMGSGLTLSDLKTVSPYNTSEMNSSMVGKLPVGPICNPSLESIKAVLNPTDTDYLYFYADIKTGIVYFSKTYEEHVQIQKEVG